MHPPAKLELPSKLSYSDINLKSCRLPVFPVPHFQCQQQLQLFLPLNHQLAHITSTELDNTEIVRASAQTAPMKATPDDLLALISIYRSCTEPQRNNDTDPEDLQRQQKIKTPINNKVDWGNVVSLLPQQRNRIVLLASATSDALEKYHSAKKDDSFQFVNVSILEQLETTVMNLREAIQIYSHFIPSFRQTLTIFWNIDDLSTNESIHTDLTYLGNSLVNRLIHQLDWDKGLLNTVIKFIDEEMYSYDSNAINYEFGKMRVYTNAFSAMLKIDKLFWKLVENEVLSELKLTDDEPAGTAKDMTGITIDLKLQHLSHKYDQGIDTNRHGSRQSLSLHEVIASKDSAEDAVDAFLKYSRDEKLPHESYPCISSMLVVGEEGCGKTFMLDSIQQYIQYQQFENEKVKQLVTVIRPSQQDFARAVVGSSEDRWVALFSYAETEMKNGKRVVLLLDNLDRLLSMNELDGVSSTQFHVGRRCKSLFLRILETMNESLTRRSGYIMLICTSRSRCEEVSGKFHKIFTINQMNEMQRQRMITTCLSIRPHASHENLKYLISLAVKHSAGRTPFEISQCCRDAILSEAASIDINQCDQDLLYKSQNRLRCLDAILQTRTPQSLKGGFLDGVVDMIVFTPEELVSRLTMNNCGEAILPLLGADAKRAYESIMNVVITPLCCSDKINSVLFGGSASIDGFRQCHRQKSIRVGALLAGGPGVGKTSLAYHCASVAAHMMSGVTLLDVSCTSLIHKEIGGSERAVHRLFAAVRAAAPCILLLDGIENVAPKRGNDYTTEGTMDRVLSTFLTEMDGIGDDGAMANVGVIGITYNPDLIDPSLLRPGRLEKTVTLNPPDFEARKELVSQNINELQFDFKSAGYFDPKSKDDIAQYVAMESTGMYAVDIIAICKEAAMECLRELSFNVADSTVPPLRGHHFKAAINIIKGKKIS